MKKALLTLSIMAAVAVGTQGAFAWSWGCNSCQKADSATGCGCPVQKVKDCDKPCAKPCEPCAEPCNPCEKKESCDCPKSCEECAKAADAMCGTCEDKKLEEFYCRLKLSDCQKDAARNLREKYKCETDAIKDKMKTDKGCLCDAISASCLDKAAVREGERTLRQDRRDMKTHLKKIDKEFKCILDCGQQ